MGTYDEVNPDGRNFLLALFERADADPAFQVSMYDVGQSLGLDRAQSSRVAEDLMGLGLVEVRTLSGAIAMSAEGLAAARYFGAGGGTESDEVRLGTERVMDEAVRLAVTEVTDGLKAEAGSCGFDFETLNEMVADLKTIDAQMTSPRPKTAVVRECLASIRATLGGSKAPRWAARIDRLTADR